MKTHVEFRSEKFPPYDGEEAEINPGCWGKRLAEFLAGGLSREGFEVQEPIAEDWGVAVPNQNDQFPLWIGCGNYAEYPDGFLCFIEPHTPVVRRWFRKIDTVEKVTALQAALHRVLSADASIRDIRWWTYEEFNSPHAEPSEPHAAGE
ncbi:MAG: hypothetical protein HY000_09470 [Planctomycetes bacterium]|nr:hypothetical protein [Planctomycetota bacterium]